MKKFSQFFLAMIFIVCFRPAFGQTQSSTTNNNVAVQTQSVLDLPAAERTPQYPNGIVPNIVSPTIFQQNGLPGSADGILVTNFFCGLVPNVYIKANKAVTSKNEGVQYTFTPVGVNYTKNCDVKGQTEDIQTSDLTKIPLVAPGKCYLYPIGLIQCEATGKRPGEVTSASILAGVNIFAATKLQGHSNYRILYYPAHLGANIGIASSGIGAAISPGASGFVHETLTGALAGLGMSKGSTFTEGKLHITVMIFVEVKGEPDKQWPVVDLNDLQPKPAPPALASAPMKIEKPAPSKCNKGRELTIQIVIENIPVGQQK